MAVAQYRQQAKETAKRLVDLRARNFVSARSSADVQRYRRRVGCSAKRKIVNSRSRAAKHRVLEPPQARLSTTHRSVLASASG